MSFNIEDKVALYGNYFGSHKVVDKGFLYSELNSKQELYKLSGCGEVWYPKEALSLWIEESVEEIQEKCSLCQKYEKPLTLRGFCLGLKNEQYVYDERYTKCDNCKVYIENS